MKPQENIAEALRALRGNRTRATLTILIIAFGIMSMVGVLTSIDGVKYWLRSSFSTLGANTFIIQQAATNVRIGGARRQQQDFPPIEYREALRLKNEMQERLGAAANLRASGSFASVAAFGTARTNNNIRVTGTDENFLRAEAYDLAEGRSLTADDVAHRRNVAVIGHELKVKLFPDQSPIDRYVRVDRNRYRVVGLLAERGTSFGSAGDKVCMIPVTTLQNDYPSSDRSYELNVYVDDAARIGKAADLAAGLFRIIRGLKPEEPDNFAVVLSDSFVNDLMNNLQILTLSATLITLITLFGASIGLMNIMLVSVTERTMEIGLRKAMGATRRQILAQFLTEAVVICQLGGLLGIALGLGAGNLVGLLLDVELMVPWAWVLGGLVVCFVVGIAAGLYPARRAAALDPIDALRYE